MSSAHKAARYIVTLGGIGYLPASGTIASICIVPVWYALRITMAFWWYCILLAAVTIVAGVIINTLYPSGEDASEIVIDECVGVGVLFAWYPSWLLYFVATFIVFRLFDITKWCGGRAIELLPGAYGIIADDVYAALLAHGCVYALTYLQTVIV